MSMAKMRKRGWIYIVIGVGLQVAGLFLDTPFVVRGTSVPFGPVVAGLGVLLLIWDYFKARKEARETAEGTPEEIKRGGSPTPPP